MATGHNGRAEEPKGERVAERVTYRKRQSTIETTFGCIKDAMGFRRLKMRGLRSAQTEWLLACLERNFKRLYSLGGLSLVPHHNCTDG